MSTDSNKPENSLPERPDLQHLKNQAKDLLKEGTASSLADAQLSVARSYGFSSWPKLKLHVELLQETGQLREAIQQENLDRVQELMTRNPELHRAKMGYNGNGPLTLVCESRTPLTPQRLAIAKWMIENGSDVHQGGDGPLMRSALRDDYLPMTELLVSHGADVNATWDGHYPILNAPCETLAGETLDWLLKHGAKFRPEVTVEYCAAIAIGTYWRNPPGKRKCLAVLTENGCSLPDTAVTAVHRGEVELLTEYVRKDPSVINRRFNENEFFPFTLPTGSGLHGVSLDGATLLHMAVEYQEQEIAEWLIDNGADVNAATTTDSEGFGGHTPLYHTIVTPARKTDELAALLLSAGADAQHEATFRKLLSASGEPEKAPVQEYHNATVLDFADQFPVADMLNHPAISAIRAHVEKSQ